MDLHRLLIPLCLISIIWIQCGPTDEEIENEARAIFHQKVQELRDKHTKECRKEAVRLAEIEVDSILAARAASPLNDSLYRPTVPGKPEFVPLDSAALNSKRSVKPILQG